MKILKVGIKNLNSLKLETSIDFCTSPLGDTGLFAITGDTGAGKTTILDAITLALYGGVARKAAPSEILSYGTVDGYAEVEFETQSGRYRSRWTIWRSRGKLDGNIQSPKQEVAKWNPVTDSYEIITDKTIEARNTVAEVSGLDYDRFTKSVLLSQGDFAAFLKADYKGRSDLLERITGTGIYTLLSMAAHERHKAERVKLENIEMQKASLQLMDEENLKELETEKRVMEASGKMMKKELDVLRQKFEKRKRFEECLKEKGKWEEEKESCIKENERFLPGRQKLVSYKKAQPWEKELVKEENLSHQVETAESEIAFLNQNISELKKKKEEIERRLKDESNRLDALKTENQGKQELFKKVGDLDLQIREKKEPVKKEITELEGLQEQESECRERQKKIDAAILTLQKEKEENEKWLEENQVLEQLGEQLGAIESQRERLLVIFKEAGEVVQEKNKKEEEANLSRQKLETAAQQLEKCKLRKKDLSEQFNALLPESIPTSRSELLTVLNRDIEAMTEQKRILENLVKLTREYNILLTELSRHEEEMDHIRVEEYEINNHLLSCYDVEEALKKKLDYRQQVYEQQQLIANYEKDRQGLEEGQPCPLCFSEVHPFREMKLKPFVNEAKADYESAKNQLEAIQKEQKKWLSRHNELQFKKENLSGAEGKNLGGQIAEKFQKIVACEEQFVEFITPGKETSVLSENHQDIARRQKDFEKKILEKKETREKLESLHARLEKIEEEEKMNEAEWQKLEKEDALAREVIRNLDNRLEDLDREKENQVKKLNTLLHPFGYEFIQESARQMFLELKEKRTAFVMAVNEKTQLASELALKLKEKEQAEEKLISFEQNYKKLSAKIESMRAGITELENRRKELFGEMDPADEKERWDSGLDQQRDITNSVKESLVEITSGLSEKMNLKQKAAQSLETLRKSRDEMLAYLLEMVKKTGFSDIEELKGAILSEEEVNQLEMQSEQLKRRELEILQHIQKIEKDLEALEPEIQEELTYEFLHFQINEKEKEYDELNHQRGSIKEKLDHQEKLRKEAGELIEKIEKQKKELLRWARLNDLIGSFDGGKFRTFAQSLTLEKLTSLANRHLQSLNGRYLIRKQEDDNLELEIIDTFQADNVRSMNTLSGGETFLVSLALALGLSDLAGRHTSIRSLFIDEGFGTLDEQTLDTAIATLENLQSQGKTIGVISHVKALKERLTSQIRVIKKSGGFSEIEVV